MPTSLGAYSARLEAVRALRTKAGRRDQQRFAIEGPTMLREALASGASVEAVYATADAYGALGELATAISERTFLVSERALAKLSDLETPPGIVAVLPLGLTPLAALLAEGEPAVLLAGVADPGNAGTLLRTGEIFGFRNAIFGRGSVEAHNPKVVRASMGAVFRTRIAVAEPGELLGAALARGYTIVAASREGVPLRGFRFPERSIVAVGNERHGVAGWLPRWDAAVSIPQAGAGESLNAGVAGAIILYEFSQQVSEKI
jgi:TrmH family RNA methyltransferase